MAATRGRMATVGAAAALLVGAGAGCTAEYDGADVETADPDAVEFAATPEYVGEVIDASEDEAYRFTMSMRLDMGDGGFGGGEGFEGELATGEVGGESMHMRMDLGSMMGQMADAAGGPDDLPPGMSLDDFVIEQVIDGEALYMRAPFFGSLAGEMEASGGMGAGEAGQAGEDLFGAFAELGDGWGRIDIDRLGDVLPGDIQQSISGQSASPDVFLDMLRSTAEVENLGTDEIDGDTVHGLAATVDFQDMLESQGMDPATFEASVGDDAVAGMLESFELPLEVWIDDDDRLRRITFTFGGDSFTEMAQESAEAEGGDIPVDEFAEMSDFEMGMTMEFSDHGDVSISIEAPANSVDITDAFVAVADDLDGG